MNQGLFWDITRPDLRPGPKDEDGSWTVVDVKGATAWTVFNWSTFENPYVGSEWRAEIDEMVRNNPKVLEQPIIRRHYFGEWAEDANQNVYAYSDEKNLADKWEPMEGDLFGMATDFGWDDGQGFCIGCWNPARPDFWVLESFKQSNMPLADALKRMEKYQERYPGLLMWGDPARKQLYMEMAIRFGACVNIAQKDEKHDFIDLLNHDLLMGRVKIVKTGNEQLIDELRSLKRLVKEDGTWVEHPRQPNDCCDTLLYVWRHGRHYRYKEPAILPKPGTPDHTNQLVRAMWEQEAKKAAARTKKAGWRRRGS